MFTYSSSGVRPDKRVWEAIRQAWAEKGAEIQAGTYEYIVEDFSFDVLWERSVLAACEELATDSE
jgi:hypothetical protein